MIPPRTRTRGRYTATERILIACAAGITMVFVVSLFGKPVYAVPVLLAPLVVIALRSARRDAASVLSIYVVLLILVPSVLIFDPLGASGTPANVLGILMLFWWFHSRLVPGFGVATSRSPVRWAVYGMGAALLASYAAVAFRTFLPEESSAADRGILFFAGCAGITLLACDGVETKARLETVLRRLAAAGGLLAGIGVYQFVTGFDINTILHIPGLKANTQLNDIVARGSFQRVAGTAAHPIEFGVVIAMLLPIAVHFALQARTQRAALLWWGAVGLYCLAIPMSLSRSAVVTVAVAAMIILPTWPRRRVVRTGALAVAFIGLIQLAASGLASAVLDLFLNIANDPSTSGRTQDYTVFAHLFSQRPVLGIGFFTFLPDIYTTFDNEYLVILVEAGIVGFLALVALLVAGMGAGRAARRASIDEPTRQLGQTLAASIAAGAIAWGTFDALSFPMAAGTMFLLIGCAGALRRLARGESTAEATAAAHPPATSASYASR